MAKTAVINVRTEPEIKNKAEKIYKGMGVSLSEAVNMFLYKSIAQSGLPFNLVNDTPNDETLDALHEAEEIISGKLKTKSYTSAQNMIADILGDRDNQMAKHLLTLRATNAFRKDVRRMHKRGADLSKLNEIVELLRTQQEPPISCQDHALTGAYTGYRDCHIAPDWILIYKIKKDALILVAARTGTHSDLFKK